MWIEVRKAPNLIIAEMWKLLLESEGVPTRILPVQDSPQGSENRDQVTEKSKVDMKEFVPYKILVPHFRVHVYEEILRKL